MARLVTDAAGAAPLTGDENDPKMQMTILPRVFGQLEGPVIEKFSCLFPRV
jgi:hypothetical protein